MVGWILTSGAMCDDWLPRFLVLQFNDPLFNISLWVMMYFHLAKLLIKFLNPKCAQTLAFFEDKLC